uniref:YadA-like family protein n=2 Tax=Pseudomonas aeruginosa TaxID=287 RepID=UPI0021D9538B
YTDAAVAGVARESRAYTDHEIAKSEEFLSAGIAAVAAQPNLPALAAGQKAVAVGTGHYNGANAVGVAFGFAPRDGVVLSGGVSGVSGEGKPVFRTSASYVW